jgi:hypothetical protein
MARNTMLATIQTSRIETPIRFSAQTMPLPQPMSVVSSVVPE